MKFFHLADIHLGAAPDAGYAWSADRGRALYESFFSVLKKAREDQVDFVLICGDLFHRQPLKRELKELDYHFRQCAPVQIVLIAGNHDYIKPESNYVNYPWSSNVHWFTKNQCMRMNFARQRVCFYGLSYDNYEITMPLYDQVKPQRTETGGDCHILLAHGGDEKHIPITWKNLERAGFDYVALGHIHKPGIFAGGRMAYSGALEPVDKNDEGPHGFIQGQWENGQLDVRFVPWAKTNYVNLEFQANSSMNWSEIKDLLSMQINKKSGNACLVEEKFQTGSTDGGSKNIYKIVLSGHKAADMLYDISEIYNLGRVVSVTDQMTWDFDWDSLYAANAGNLLGRYIQKVRQMNLDEQMREKILYYGFMALYQGGDGSWS